MSSKSAATRKSCKRSRLDKMEVVSIADFEHAQQLRRDDVLESAVDQLEALARPDMDKQIGGDLAFRFGHLRVDEDAEPPFRFSFEPPATPSKWPGPPFGAYSLHKELTSWKSSRKHRQPDDFKSSLRPRKSSKPAPRGKEEVAPKSLGDVVSRNPPLQLTTLPPEIRNAIWSLLVVRGEPIEAQFRRIQPCKKLSKPRQKVIRRFPLEPVVARVNRQLRAEVLSVFYGCNTFVFEKNAIKLFREFDMTNMSTLRKWSPSLEVAKYLTQLELRFKALPRGFDVMSVVYVLRRSASGDCIVEVNAARWKGNSLIDVEGYCLCQEGNVVSWLKAKEQHRDLVDMAGLLVSRRTLAKLGKTNEVGGQKHCESCGGEKLESVD